MAETTKLSADREQLAMLLLLAHGIDPELTNNVGLRPQDINPTLWVAVQEMLRVELIKIRNAAATNPVALTPALANLAIATASNRGQSNVNAEHAKGNNPRVVAAATAKP